MPIAPLPVAPTPARSGLVSPSVASDLALSTAPAGGLPALPSLAVSARLVDVLRKMVVGVRSAMTAFTTSIYDRISFFTSCIFSFGSTTSFEFTIRGSIDGSIQQKGSNSIQLPIISLSQQHSEVEPTRGSQVLPRRDSSALRYMLPNFSLSLAVWYWDDSKPSDITSKQLDDH
jgi:hypothetical protein